MSIDADARSAEQIATGHERERTILDVAKNHFANLGVVGVMLYDFSAAKPVYSSFSQKLMETYWTEIGVNRDSALKKAVKTGAPAGYRADFHPDGDASSHRRVWAAAEECGVTDAIGVFATPHYHSCFYIYLGLDSAVDRVTKIEMDATQQLSGLFLRRLDAFRRKTSKPALSRRETDVLQLAATGRTDKEIARALDLSPATVRTLAGRSFKKLRAGSRIEAIVAAVRLGLIMPK